MQSIDQIIINFKPEQLVLLNICLAFLMFGVALDLKVESFKELFKAPRKPLIGLTSQWILLPILTLILIFVLRPAPSIALGMILVAACPGGNVSNYAVHLAGANSALSILMTSISTIGAILITPLSFAIIAPFVPGTEELRSIIKVDTFDMIKTIITLIVIPLLSGMLLNHYLPKVTALIQRPVKILSMLIFLSFVVFAIYGNFDNIYHYLHLVFFIVFLHNALALIMGYNFARLFKLNSADKRAIAIETGIQNSGLALIIIFNFFDGLGGMAMIAAWWGVWHLISAFSLAMFWSYNRPQKASAI